ncbi:MAG: hypothetical protein HY551_07675 [Elusimicrobia bacterium]|nr:hypothetical protein [Elusimicrobiota bacterium]
MKRPLLAAFACLVAAQSLWAQSSQDLRYSPPSGGRSDELQLRSWLKSHSKVRRKLASVVRDATAAGHDIPQDLRDAPGPANVQSLKERIEQAEPIERRMLLERLPGMRAAAFDACRSLSTCARAPSLLHVENPSLVDDAVVALIRPWMILQNARGKELRIVSSAGAGEQLVRLKLGGLEKAVLEVHASPTPMGGVNVWLYGRPDPSALFDQERRALLAQGPPALPGSEPVR